VLISMGLVAMCGAAGIISLIQLNKKAVAVRTLNNARAVVQRNIDNALGVPFSITVQPAILGITTASGAVYDDDGGGDNLVNIVIPRSTGAVVKGTLTRIVLAEANADGADIRRITFRVDYTLRSRPYTFSMTTLRAMD
jgi:hypothetical protein